MFIDKNGRQWHKGDIDNCIVYDVQTQKSICMDIRLKDFEHVLLPNGVWGYVKKHGNRKLQAFFRNGLHVELI